MATIEKRESDQGDITYRVRIRLRGHPAESATFTTRTAAKEWGKRTEAAIREGRYFKGQESRKHTLADLVDRYIEFVMPTKSPSASKQAGQLIWWKDRIGEYTLANVSPALIAECRDELAAETTVRDTPRGPATVNRYLAALSHAYTIATREWGWVESNPVRMVRHLTEPQGRVRFLDDDERERLLTVCHKSSNPYLYPVVVLALSTGMRQAEILNLAWQDVDLKRGRITILRTKNKDRRGIPLVGAALDALRDHAKVRRLDSPLVFPGSNPDKPAPIRKAWDAAVAAAKIKDFRFHDLRHSAASYLAMDGCSPSEIAHILGHRTLAMVARYAHIADEHSDALIERMNRRIFRDGKA